MNEQIQQPQAVAQQPLQPAPPVQYVTVPQPVQYVQPAQPAAPPVEAKPIKQAIVFGHSTLVYWWPVWVTGYIMAALSYWQGGPHPIDGQQVWFHSSGNLGVIFYLVLFLVIVFTNVTVRGLASALVITVLVLVTVILAYLELWDMILNFLWNLNIFMNVGAYFWFSTLLFATWLVFFLVIDRLSYWRFKPGQVTHEFVFGAGSKSYDTNGMTLEKHREDLFRHWLLGLGAGDLQIHTSGAQRQTIPVPNVLFVGSKIERLQRMIAEEPGDTGS